MSLSKLGELRREDVCADVSTFFPKAIEDVRMIKCHGQRGNQEWVISQVTC